MKKSILFLILLGLVGVLCSLLLSLTASSEADYGFALFNLIGWTTVLGVSVWADSTNK
jgi:hypothetical protein